MKKNERKKGTIQAMNTPDLATSIYLIYHLRQQGTQTPKYKLFSYSTDHAFDLRLAQHPAGLGLSAEGFT